MNTGASGWSWRHIEREDGISVHWRGPEARPGGGPSPAPLDRHDAPKLLLADDDADILALMDGALRADWSQAQIVTVQDGRSAYLGLLAFKPDLLVADLTMPNMPGEEVCRRIRRRTDKTTKILVVSGRPHSQNVVRRGDADDHLCKPFSPAQLRAAAARLLLPRFDRRSSTRTRAV